MDLKKIECSLCSSTSVMGDETFMVGENGNYICDDCFTAIQMIHKVESLSTTLKSKQEAPTVKEKAPVHPHNQEWTPKKALSPSPKSIKKHLDMEIIGQENAKKELSISLYNHINRNAMNNNIDSGVVIEKNNMLLIGPTGTGKTHMVESLATLAKVPFVSVDITSFSQVGYQGNSIDDILSRLYEKSESMTSGDNVISLCERGIVLIDEIDKTIPSNKSKEGVSDVKVQQSLLKMLEGCDVTIDLPTNIPGCTTSVTINTKNILFLCAGAFTGLDDIINKRLRKGTASIGFGGTLEIEKKETLNCYNDVTTEDLVTFGLTPELIGRLHSVVPMHKLDKKMIKKIIKEPRNSIFKQYTEMFALHGVSLEIKNDALNAIADMCIENKTGTRGLRGIFAKALAGAMFEIPSNPGLYTKCIINKNVITKGEEPKYVK